MLEWRKQGYREEQRQETPGRQGEAEKRELALTEEAEPLSGWAGRAFASLCKSCFSRKLGRALFLWDEDKMR